MNPPRDHVYMRTALNLAEHGVGRTAPNPTVGCIIVKDAKVLAAAITADGGRPHAETIALEKAGAESKGATAYVTLEPCSHTGKTGPCAQALIDAGIVRAVIACEDPDPRVSGRGIKMLKDAGIEVVVGMMEKEARAMNAGFFTAVTQGRPYVTLKVATTKDDKIAPLNAKRQHFITGDMARAHSHIMRSMHDAVVVGIGTVLGDDPMLTTRLVGLKHTITRVVLDSKLDIPLDSKLVKSIDEAPLWVCYSEDPHDKAEKLEKLGVKLLKTEVSAISAMKALAAEGITRVLIEGGTQVHSIFAKEGLGDRLLWYRSPDVMGDGVMAFGGLSEAEVVQKLGLKHLRRQDLDKDLLEIYEKDA